MMESLAENQASALSSSGFQGLTWQVHKFGGTSVANAECITRCADILDDQLSLDPNDPTLPSNGTNLAVVVSAMGGKPKVTDLLLDSVTAAAQRDDAQVGAYLDLVLDKHKVCLETLFPATEQERLLAIIRQDIADIRDILKTVALMKWRADRISELVSGYGELWSAQILTALLRQRFAGRAMDEKHTFVYLDARRVITVDEEAIQDGAVEWQLSQEKLKEVYQTEVAQLDSNTYMHFVITGYVASNTDGVATTLQRDGSDYSAAIMGRLLQSQHITIWTDVNGVLSADPRRVPAAQVISEVSYNEAMELAYFGAKVIHPKTMQPAISSNPQIPIYIRNTFNASFPGTRIYATSTSHTNRDKVVCGFSSVENMALINVEGSGLVGVLGVDRRIFGCLEQHGINVALISQGSSEHSVTFSTEASQATAAKQALEEEFSRELQRNRISKIEMVSPCSIIAAVGDGMMAVTGVAGRFFSALGDAKINILAIAQGSSERNISAVVLASDSTRALRAVHAAFRLSHSTIRVAVVGLNELGVALMKLLESQRSMLKEVFDIDVHVCVVVPNSDGSDVVHLSEKRDATASLKMKSFELDDATSRYAFRGSSDLGSVDSTGVQALLGHLIRNESPSHVVFDCTNNEEIGRYHAAWLRAGVDVVTANNTGMSGPRAQRAEISAAEKLHGKHSAQYLREVTIGGGLPVISTLRSLIHSGDKIRRIDGILSVSLSFIMFRISPPSNITQCSDFDLATSHGAFVGDLPLGSSEIGVACSFSQAVKEAISLGLMEEDPTMDLNNEYSARILMVLAKELGMDMEVETETIRDSSDKLLELVSDGTVDYHDIPASIDAQVQARVEAARAKGCVLRHVASVDVNTRSLSVNIMEVPDHHVFAVTPPSCECVRFFTHRHQSYPLIVQGPSAGADSTASALLAELVQLMRGKSTPRSVALARTGSGSQLMKREMSFVNNLSNNN